MKFDLPSKIPNHAQKVFSGVIFDVYQWQQVLFDGSVTTFEASKRANAVSIIPIIDDTLLILHEQQPSHPPRIGFVGGHVDPGEDPFQAAIRELHEETGYVFETLTLIQVDDIGGSKVDWWDFHFVAIDPVRKDPPHTEPGEKIALELVSFENAKRYARDNIYMSNDIMERIDSIEELRALNPITQADIRLK